MQKAFAVAIAAGHFYCAGNGTSVCASPICSRVRLEEARDADGNCDKGRVDDRGRAVVSIDVRDASGTITNWALKLGSPKVLEQHYR